MIETVIKLIQELVNYFDVLNVGYNLRTHEIWVEIYGNIDIGTFMEIVEVVKKYIRGIFVKAEKSTLKLYGIVKG